jgi:hypothetical protein
MNLGQQDKLAELDASAASTPLMQQHWLIAAACSNQSKDSCLET